jgi:hypothetical protein
MTTFPTRRRGASSVLDDDRPVEWLSDEELWETVAAGDALESKTGAPVADCGEIHPVACSSRELSSTEREVGALAQKVVWKELGVRVVPRWYLKWDGQRANGRPCSGYLCGCSPHTIHAEAGRLFWASVKTLLHEGRHAYQWRHGGRAATDAVRARREVDAERWASDQLARLQAAGY